MKNSRQSKSFIETIRKYYELILFLTYREIRIRYKQTLLGVVWTVLQPLLQMAVFTFVFSRLGKMDSEGLPYPVFVLTGLILWSFFSSALSRGVPIIINYPGLVTKIYFPREIFPTFATLGLLVDYICSFLVLMGFYLIFKTPIHLTGIVLSFFILFILIIFTIGFLFFASTINVFFRDATYAVNLLIQVWFFMTPVVYPLSKIPMEFRVLYDLNPMVGLVESYRSLLIHGTILDAKLLLESLVMSAITFYFGYRFLKRYEMKLADVI